MVESSNSAEAKRLGGALRVLRTRAKMTLQQAAENFGVSTTEAWRKYEVGLAPGIFKPGVQTALAAAVNATVDELMAEAERFKTTGIPIGGGEIVRPTVWSRAPTLTHTYLPVRDRVQAGAWLLADDTIQAAQPINCAIGPDPRFAHAEQWLSVIVGDSMDRADILEGDIGHFVDAPGSGYYPKTGDIVEVERLRFDGSERELTLKQVEVTEDGVLLWPRSTNARWQNPLDLREGAERDDTVEVRIRGVLLSTIRRRQL